MSLRDLNQTDLTTAVIPIVNNQGTQATSALQVQTNTKLDALIATQGTLYSNATATSFAAQQARTINVYGPSGTRATDTIATEMRLDGNAASTDSFGRLRVSTPDYQFDAQLVYQINNDQWDSAFTTGGTVTYDRTNRSALLTATANGTAVLQSHYAAHYTPGRSQLALLTFQMGGTIPAYACTRRVGYWDGYNGVYLEHASDGIRIVLASTTDNAAQTVPQGLWNIDKLDGTGPSGLTLDLSKVQIFVVSLQALYVGRVIVGFDIDGLIFPVHAFTHANKITTTYMAQASLPVRYEVASTGSNVATMRPICASVMSEGGGGLTEVPARSFAISNGAATISVNSRRPILSIRAKSQLNEIWNNGIILPTAIGTQAGQNLVVELVRNGVLSGAAWVSVDSNSIAEYDVTASTISGGSTLWTAYSTSSSGLTAPIDPNALARSVIAYSRLLGVGDTLSVVCTSLGGAIASTAALNWKEIR